jgi:uncharacterized membrane-anchored protein YhcB (DUF1043 family)
MWTAIIGFFVGVMFGVIVMAMAAMAGKASRDSEQGEEILKNHKK